MPTTVMQWNLADPMPTARAQLGAATGTDGRIYAIGGCDGAGKPLADCAVYDCRSGRWDLTSPLRRPRRNVAVATSPDGTIYAIGGYPDTQTVEAYDSLTDKWNLVAPMPLDPDERNVAVAWSDRIYVIGSTWIAGAGHCGLCLSYDTAADEWREECPPPPAARTGANMAAAVAGDGRVYVAGGNDGARASRTVTMFEPRSGIWSEAADLPTPRWGHALVAANGLLYAIGGQTSDALHGVDMVEAFDPFANRWSKAPPLTGKRRYIAATAVGDAIYVMGGADDRLLDRVEVLATYGRV